MDLGIKKAWNNGNGDAIIFTAILASIASNCIPTPADGIFFWREQVDKQELEEGKITPKQYWIRNSLGYYGYTAGWYLLVLGIICSIGGDYKNKARIGIGLLSSGLIVGIIAKNIEKDEKLQSSQSTTQTK